MKSTTKPVFDGAGGENLKSNKKCKRGVVHKMNCWIAKKVILRRGFWPFRTKGVFLRRSKKYFDFMNNETRTEERFINDETQNEKVIFGENKEQSKLLITRKLSKSI